MQRIQARHMLNNEKKAHDFCERNGMNNTSQLAFITNIGMLRNCDITKRDAYFSIELCAFNDVARCKTCFV